MPGWALAEPDTACRSPVAPQQLIDAATQAMISLNVRHLESSQRCPSSDASRQWSR
jgi:hypothetical protein